ncbi:MAG TPA: DUF4193 family protein [Acidimicrobiales bacterium]|nr:DUF4193 family protein [Acidimicrobiales bacterium]
MGVVERVVEEHFTEGEPDLEPPEEMAIGELDDEALLEEELDNEDIAEEDVDEDVLAASLEDLVHVADDEDDEAEDEAVPRAVVVDDEADLDAELDLEDVEESLDRILQVRMAIDQAALDDDEDVELTVTELMAGDDVVAPCRPDEFVCMGCFLVKNRVLLAEPRTMLCRDCS